jgi:AAA+ ATPase superfamily predicted ATPase
MMGKFVDREQELAELNQLLAEQRAQLVIVYGRRRIGKTTLLLHWARASGQPVIYWVATRDTADNTRLGLTRALWAWAYPDVEPPRFDHWPAAFDQAARLLGDRRVILICDEFPYAVESDPSLPSHLQAAWDHLFKDGRGILILAGSHIGMMVDLMTYQAPLYGRLTAQLPVGPLPFAALKDFFPRYPAAERLAVYAVLGGVPAYLERFDDGRLLSANIRRHLMQRTGMFHSEPFVLIGDLVRETRTYEAILRAIASGHHTPDDISRATGLKAPNLSPYLKRLQELGLVERRIPATVPLAKRRVTTLGRYYLLDPYLRFYFRFIEPHLDLVEQQLTERLWEIISEQFRAFVAFTFEELCREWTLVQARAGRLPFSPDLVGAHWAADAQVDVVAINWREKAILLGEAKWGIDPVGPAVIRGLVDKAPLVVPEKGEAWTVHYALFARAGFTEATQAEAAHHGALLVDLAILDRDPSASSGQALTQVPATVQPHSEV